MYDKSQLTLVIFRKQLRHTYLLFIPLVKEMLLDVLSLQHLLNEFCKDIVFEWDFVTNVVSRYGDF